jgi:hypothetical protein
MAVAIARRRRANQDGPASTIVTGIATLPGIATAIEAIVHVSHGVASSPFLTQKPLLVATFAGPALFLVSFGMLPWREASSLINIVRVTHLGSWLCGAWVSVLLLLDV